MASEYFGVRHLNIENSPYSIDFFIYSVKETIRQQYPSEAYIKLVNPTEFLNDHYFTTLKGWFLASPGTVLNPVNANPFVLKNYSILIDSEFFTELKLEEFDALAFRYQIIHTNITHPLYELSEISKVEERNPTINIVYDNMTCLRGVNPKNLRSAINKSKRFTQKNIIRIFDLDFFDRLLLRMAYYFNNLHRGERARIKNLKSFKIDTKTSEVLK